MDVSRFKFSQRAARFYENNDADFDVSLNENKNTKRKTETDMRIFSSYLVSINEPREPEAIPADELDRHLATYFSVIKKHDGNEYEPASLRGMLCSIERYLRSKNYPISLTRDAEFTNTRNMLKERQKLLRDLSKTEKGTKSDAMAMNTVQRLNQLYLAKEFGPHNPSAVINALCFAFFVHLKIRKAIDHKQLLWGDIALKVSSANDEYLCYEPLPGYEYCRLPLKGISSYRVLAQSPETSLWDPISIYKLFRHRRPSNMMTPDSPFYLGIAVLMHDSQQQAWFKPLAMGVNKLNDLVRMIRDITGTLCQGPSYPFDMYEALDRDGDDAETDNDICNSSNQDNDDLASLNSLHIPTEDNGSKRIAVKDRNMENVKDNSSLLTQKSETVLTERRDSFENDIASVKEPTDALEDARQQIKSVLDNLTSETKSEVIKWLNTTVCSSGSGESHRKKESRKRIQLSVELDDMDLESCSCVEKTAKIQVIAEKADDQHEPEMDQQKTVCPPVQDATDGLPKLSDKDTTESTFYDQTDSLHKMRQYVFKRALSYPNDLKDAKVPKVQGNDRHVDSSANPYQLPVSLSVPADRLTNVINSTSHSTDTNSIDKASDSIHPVQGYNPYAAWALDPRFAMFMRNGFMQTYQDFVSMYTHHETKDASNN